MIKVLALLITFLLLLHTHMLYPQGVVADIEGNEYRTVVLGDQEWMAENLRTTKYNDGTSIFTGLSNYAWSITTEGAFAVYTHHNVLGINSSEEMISAYGKLYNWYAVNDRRGICPEGWRIPTDRDWQELVDFIKTEYGLTNEWEDENGIGNNLKACWQVDSAMQRECGRFEHPRWSYSPNHHANDKVGFSGLPAGGRYYEGTYSNIGTAVLWWSSTTSRTGYAWGRMLGYYHGGVYRYSGNKKTGFSVRCLKE